MFSMVLELEDRDVVVREIILNKVDLIQELDFDEINVEKRGSLM